MGHPFPLLPEMVMEVHQGSEAPSALLDLVVEEMRVAALKGAVDADMYTEFFLFLEMSGIRRCGARAGGC